MSIGINLNPNNACNWRCIYCQVPDLVRGSAPAINLKQLSKELHSLLDDVLHGDFYDRYGVPEQRRLIRDIAVSGNGEPTSAQAFEAVIELLGDILNKTGLSEKVNVVLITNGSLIHQAHVQKGLVKLSELDGQIWFKLDRVTRNGVQQINNAAYSPQRIKQNLEIATKHCKVWIQTSLFALDGKPPSEQEWQAYVDFLNTFQNQPQHDQLCGVLLYGLARPSMQVEAPRLQPLSEQTMQQYADSIRHLGYQVKVSI